MNRQNSWIKRVIVLAFIGFVLTATEHGWAAENSQLPAQGETLEAATELEKAGLELKQQGKYQEAEIKFRQAVEIRERALPLGHPDLAIGLNHLGLILDALGHYSEAEQLLRRALELREEMLPPDDPKIAINLNNLATVIISQGRFIEAEPIVNRAVAIFEKIYGSKDVNVADCLNNLGDIMEEKRQLRDAEILFRKAIDIRSSHLGFNHSKTADAIMALAVVLRDQGRLGEAELYAQKALNIYEIILPMDHPSLEAGLNGMGMVRSSQNRLNEAEGLFRRSLEIAKKAFPPNHPKIARSMSNLGSILRYQGHLDEAEKLSLSSLAIKEKILPPDHPSIAVTINNLAEIMYENHRFKEAENFVIRAIIIRERGLGSENSSTARSLNTYAEILFAQNRLFEAEIKLRRALSIGEKYTDIPELWLKYNRNMGAILLKEGRFREALTYYTTSTRTLDQLFAYTQGLNEEVRHTFLGQYTHIYREFLELLLKLHEQDAKAGYDREFLAAASRNQSRIFSELLRQGDIQRISQHPQFLALKDQRQSLLNQLQTLREKRALLPLTTPNLEGQKADFSQRIDTLATDLQGVEDTLRRDYPRYLELLQPTAITVEQLQRELLRPGDALLTVVLLPERTVLLTVTPTQFTLHTLPLTQTALTDQVATLRAGLQLDAQGGLSALRQLDPAALHQLYQTLIAPIEPTLKDAKRLLVIADGPLYSLPLELLLTSYDDTQKERFETAKRQADGSRPERALLGQYRDLPYLGDRYTFRYLPSLAALAAQRRYPKPTVPTTHPFIAFADPVFDPAETDQKTTSLTPDTQKTLALLNRSGALNGTLPRLPQTADEARALQTTLPGAPLPYLRQDAQEATLKQLAKDGQLRGLRYLLLATHGLLGGEFLPPAPKADPKPALLDLNGPGRTAPTDPLGQPALALTLVDPLDGQDGFLTLKEVIEDLDLTTDLAILSACNTAGDSQKSATGEGFAGMTRAFLFAGARHLWVSHWAVESAATRDLITTAVHIREAGRTDPAEALAEAQRTLRTSPAIAFGETLQGQPLFLARAHPFFWAPFVTVGE